MTPERTDPPPAPGLIDEITAMLPDLFRTGGRAADLLVSGMPFVDLVVPPNGRPDGERAMATEALLTAACAALGTPDGDAARILLGIRSLTGTGRTPRVAVTPPGPLRSTLTQRRTQAGSLYGVLSGTFRRPRYEGKVTVGLGLEVYRRVRGARGSTVPLSPRAPAAPVPPAPYAVSRPRWTPALPAPPTPPADPEPTRPRSGPTDPPPAVDPTGRPRTA